MSNMTLNKTATESLAKRCRDNFSDTTRQDGQQLFDAGDVDLVSLKRQKAHVHVPCNERMEELCIDVGWQKKSESNQLQVSCQCGDSIAGANCEHLWAAILKLDEQRVYAQVPGTGLLELVEEFDFEKAGDGTSKRDLTQPLPAYRPIPAQPPAWTQRLRRAAQGAAADARQNRSARTATGRTNEVLYLLDIEKSRQKGRPVVMFFQRQLKKNGVWGKPKPWRVNQETAKSITDAEDCRLLELLLESPAYSEYSNLISNYAWQTRLGSTVAPALADVLLPRLCATGRFGYSLSRTDAPDEIKLLTWDDGPAWRLGIQIKRDEQRPVWRIAGRLKRDEQSFAVTEPRLVLPGGLIVFTESISRLHEADNAGWISSLCRIDDIEVPLDQADQLVQELWQMPDLPTLDLGDELRWEQVRVEPRPHARITPPDGPNRQKLRVTISLEYDGQMVGLRDTASGLTDPQQRRVLIRDFIREQQFLEQLNKLGFSTPSPYDPEPVDFELPPKRLPSAVRDLLQSGWQVEADGKLVRRPGEVRLSVTSGMDWFDLEASVDFDGLSVGLPKLLQALRRGEGFVTLDDGTQGMLPEEWLSRYGLLADLGEADGNKLRFVPSQAVILDALLAAQPQVQIDSHFEELRQRVRKFEGVAPAEPPSSFVGHLREYQSEGLGWLHFLRDFHFGGCLADDMGLGKTVQVLALLDARRLRETVEREPRKPSLAVVPRSLIFNWIEEARRFTPALRVLNYTGLDRQQSLERITNYDLMLTTYGTLRRDVLKFQELDFDYAILDEAQAIKNASSQAAKACRLIRADHRLAMSGTPIENHIGELWSLFEFLNPGMLGRSSTLKSFASGNVQTGNSQTGNSPGSGRSLLTQALRPFILRRTKEQVLTELPEKTEQTLHCELDHNERKLYDELRGHYRAALDRRIGEVGLQKAKIHVLEALLRLRQAACHPGLLDKTKVKESSAKLETLLEKLSEVLAEGHKALVFSQFTSLLSIVRHQLHERGLIYEYLDGRTRDRQKRVERFQQDTQCPLFLISLKAGGQGLNLTAADYVFILDPWWNPAVEAQAVDRAHRMGQERRVFAYRLIARDTVEEKILALQQTKRQLADAIISQDNSVIGNLTADDLQLLLS